MTTVFKQVGPYEILKQIGHGGMAVVFMALDTRSDRQVALKLVQQGNDREAREIVEAERFGAELQKRFGERGTHVPAVYEYGIDDDCGYFYVAMEYLDGENLSEVISRGSLPPERAVDIAIELARFLEEAHGFEAVIDGRNHQSLLHLDLKPRNVRITSADQVKVLDFGTAKALSLSRKVTRNDFGSVAYLSPERLETGEVDARADLWALGVVLYEMLRGVPPFRAADTRRLERVILLRRPAPSLTEQCPVGLQAVVARMLDPVATERYASAREIREDLERFKANHRTLAEDLGWPARASDDAVTRRTRTAAEGADEKTRRTRPPGAGPVSVPLSAGVPQAVRQSPPPLPQAPAAPRPVSKGRRLARTALLLVALALILNEISVGIAAGHLAGQVVTRDFETLADAWTEYAHLEDRSHLHFATASLKRTLVERTSELADRVIASYRTTSATVREAQWQTARDALVRAVALAPGDSELRGALRYCEGHLHRINGEAKKGRDDPEGARRDLTEAVVAFRQAAELRQRWPDPYIGLLRTFVVGLEDVDNAADALEKAQQNGYRPVERDLVQLADGYRGRGSALVRSARQVEGLPQERDYLTRAVEAYQQALDLYSKAGSFGNTPQLVARTQRALLQVEQSLGDLIPPLVHEAAPPAGVEASSPPPQGSVVFQGNAPWQ